MPSSRWLAPAQKSSGSEFVNRLNERERIEQLTKVVRAALQNAASIAGLLIIKPTLNRNDEGPEFLPGFFS
jgi:hypothetical protein